MGEKLEGGLTQSQIEGHKSLSPGVSAEIIRLGNIRRAELGEPLITYDFGYSDDLAQLPDLPRDPDLEQENDLPYESFADLQREWLASRMPELERAFARRWLTRVIVGLVIGVIVIITQQN